MKTSNLSGKLLLRPTAYGFATCIIASLIQQAVMTEEMRYTSNWTFFLLLLLLSVGAFLYVRKFSDSMTSMRQLFQTSLLFGIAAGIAIALFSYFYVTVFDTDFLQKSLEASQARWVAKGYSKEAIASQVELTDTFQNPLKWSFVLMIFYLILTTGLFFIVGSSTRKNVPSMTGMQPMLK